MATMRSSTAGQLLLRRAATSTGRIRGDALAPARGRGARLRTLPLILASACLGLLPLRASAQAPADSAAILLQAADGLSREGKADAASALLAYIRAHFPGTPAAEEAVRRLAAAPVPPHAGGRAGSGRTELTVWGTSYGIWAGLALPGALDAQSPEAYGLGLLVGAPAGFLVSRAYAREADVTEGEARAITFGGTWGTWQGFGWAKVAGLLERTITPLPPPCPGCVAPAAYKQTSGKAVLRSMLLGGVAGIAAGAALGNSVSVSPGAATTVNLAGVWGTGYGFGAAALFDAQGNAPLTLALLTGDAAVVAAAAAWPAWRLSRERARLVSTAGLAGVLAGAGIDLIVRSDNARVSAAIPMTTGVVGLLLGAHATRSMPAEAAANVPGARDHGRPGGEAGGAGALLELRRGRLEVGTVAAAPVLRLDRRGERVTSLLLPLFHASF